ncbi:MAG: hypothetical protein IKU96_03915 [Alistipes sp.]|nr:hypothetical protein [Alistipes sp.]
MKKTIQFLLVIGMLMSYQIINAQSKVLSKAIQKEYKAKKKELEKGGWEVFGSSRSVDVTILKFYEQLNENENLSVVTGLAGAFSQKSIGRAKASVDAQTTYARQATAVISGRFINEIGSVSDDVEAEVEKFNSIYEGAVMKEIKNELIEQFSIIRQVETTSQGKPVYEMQTYYFVDNTAARQARVRAFKSSIGASETLKKHADKLEEIIKEDVVVE